MCKGPEAGESLVCLNQQEDQCSWVKEGGRREPREGLSVHHKGPFGLHSRVMGSRQEE